MSFWQRLRNLFDSLTRPAPPPPPPQSADDAPECQLGHVEIPADEPDVPVVASAQAASAQDVLEHFSGDLTNTAEVLICYCTVRPEFGLVNIRMGPGKDFAQLATSTGGTRFDLVGTAEADAAGYRWFAVKIGPRSGWIRADLLELDASCSQHPDINEEDVAPPPTQAPTTPPPTLPDARFSVPAAVRLTQGFSSGHPGYDLGTRTGTPILSPAPCTVIRRVTCPNCEGEPPNIHPCDDAIYWDAAWGYGYGNFVTVRIDYNHLPAALRSRMDQENLRDGYAYVLYAHFSRLDVRLWQRVEAGQVLGLTGNHGCSTAEHLHFEVRIGKDTTVDGRWLSQTAVDPSLMFAF